MSVSTAPASPTATAAPPAALQPGREDHEDAREEQCGNREETRDDEAGRNLARGNPEGREPPRVEGVLEPRHQQRDRDPAADADGSDDDQDVGADIGRLVEQSMTRPEHRWDQRQRPDRAADEEQCSPPFARQLMTHGGVFQP
ncbi:hypothetical protein GCM10025876_08630 [Demequina litorisediminis]|uniref:Uncharacterized protein n=1 Tax=Demequina litorisediminis TaxID=1849022 RepID=A0ABQ6IA37_9MICO|nr:hypothetical protein GCM10025876_08630 [Demequina litorisediminis]